MKSLVFSAKEITLLRHLSKGLSGAEIGFKMGCSEKTIESKKTALFRKTKTWNNVTLVVYAIKHGLIRI